MITNTPFHDTALELMNLVRQLGWFKKPDFYWIVGTRAMARVYEEGLVMSKSAAPYKLSWIDKADVYLRIFSKCLPLHMRRRDFLICGTRAYSSGGDDIAILVHKDFMVGAIYCGECRLIGDLRDRLMDT